MKAFWTSVVLEPAFTPRVNSGWWMTSRPTYPEIQRFILMAARPISVTVILILGLMLTRTSAAAIADIRIDSIERTPNGITLTWTNSVPGYAYTLQHRAFPDSGSWRNVWTRYRWPGAMTRWTEPALLLGETGFYRVVAEPMQLPQRGQILAVESLDQFSLSDVQYWLNRDGVPSNSAQSSVNYYRIVYETVDPFGLAIKASGGLFVPVESLVAMPLLSDQHESQIYKPWVPSQNDSYWFSEALFFASSGYVTQMPDYLGLGESPGLHPFLHAQTEASAVVDMLRAVKSFCADDGISLNGQVFLTGYGQGGHATAAAQREIEAHHTGEFTLTASAPMEGLYDVTGILKGVAASNDFRKPFGIVYSIASWLPIYEFADTMEELLVSPYDQTLPPLFDGLHALNDDILPAMAAGVAGTLNADFLNAILSDTNHSFWLATADNDLLDWRPQAPMHLFHCNGDDRVPYWNAVAAQKAYIENGACCVELINPETTEPLNQSQCWLPSLIAVKKWFDGLKQDFTAQQGVTTSVD
jgi:Secretory lipase